MSTHWSPLAGLGGFIKILPQMKHGHVSDRVRYLITGSSSVAAVVSVAEITRLFHWGQASPLPNHGVPTRLNTANKTPKKDNLIVLACY